MIIVNYGSDILKTTRETLEASDIKSYLKPHYSVSIKPNLVVARAAEDGATAHPEVVEAIILFLKGFGINKIKIIESSGIGNSTKSAFKNCGYEKLSTKYGILLIDLKSDSSTKLKCGEYHIDICNEALNTDFLINVPVLKAHCQTQLTCCMKNLKGCIPDGEKRRFHSLGIHRPTAALNALLKTGYCVVDGICGDLTFEEGGSPIEGNRIIAGQNPLTVDSFCAELIGYRADEIEYITYGKKIGVGEYYKKSDIIELNTQNKPIRKTVSSRAADRYKNLINEDAACSVCYSSLIYALYRLEVRTKTDGKIHIGQGFKGKSSTGIGIGNCARGFGKCVEGCPPKAIDIINALR